MDVAGTVGASSRGRLLSQLPLPPPGRSGWPWDRETVVSGRPGSGLAWPRISIVTPSHNQADFVEETVRSVLLQGYPNLEYIVMDGGSTDGTLQILRRYERYLDCLISGADGGQAAAVAEGFRRSSGDILGFVNSDDLLLPGALERAGRFFSGHAEAEVVVGKSVVIDSTTRITYIVPGIAPSFRSLLFWGSGGFNQPASFWRRPALMAAGMFDSTLRFSFDFDMFLRLTRRKKAAHLDCYLAAFRMHPASKTCTISDVQRSETEMLRRRHGIGRYPPWFLKLAKGYYHGRYLMSASRHRLSVLLKLERPPALKELPPATLRRSSGASGL